MATKQELMLELEAIVEVRYPHYANRPELMYAALYGILSAMIPLEDLQKTVDLWSDTEDDKNDSEGER